MWQDIQWVFMDMGSTLSDESGAYECRVREAIAGTQISYQAFWDTMVGFYQQNQKGDIKALAYYGLPKPEWHREKERLYPDAEECLKQLRQRFHIGVIANQSLGTEERLQNFGVRKYIDLVIASAEEGVAKPDPRIYQLALERAGCCPQNAVMVGDRLDNDIVPAKRLGMKTIWVRQGLSGRYYTPRTEEERADFVANNLTEVWEELMG